MYVCRCLCIVVGLYAKCMHVCRLIPGPAGGSGAANKDRLIQVHSHTSQVRESIGVSGSEMMRQQQQNPKKTAGSSCSPWPRAGADGTMSGRLVCRCRWCLLPLLSPHSPLAGLGRVLDGTGECVFWDEEKGLSSQQCPDWGRERAESRRAPVCWAPIKSKRVSREPISQG